jgi:hypothetical protein
MEGGRRIGKYEGLSRPRKSAHTLLQTDGTANRDKDSRNIGIRRPKQGWPRELIITSWGGTLAHAKAKDYGCSMVELQNEYQADSSRNIRPDDNPDANAKVRYTYQKGAKAKLKASIQAAKHLAWADRLRTAALSRFMKSLQRKHNTPPTASYRSLPHTSPSSSIPPQSQSQPPAQPQFLKPLKPTTVSNVGIPPEHRAKISSKGSGVVTAFGANTHAGLVKYVFRLNNMQNN